MIIMISRQFGAGGLSVGEALAAAIGAELLDERTIIAELASRGGFSAEYLQRIDEKPPTLASTFLSDIAQAGVLVAATEWRSTEATVLDELRNLVMDHAAKGDVVVIGHGGSKLLAERVTRGHIFSMMLLAGRQWRIEQVMRRFSIDRTAAEERVRHTDDLRKRYLAHFFATDMYDARTYDLVLNTQRVGIDAAIRIAVEAVQAARSVTG